MHRPTTLAAWLAYLETLHPKSIEMGLDRVAAVHAKMSAALVCPVVTVTVAIAACGRPSATPTPAVPVDPMTGKSEWGLRAVQDDPDSDSWGGGNVFDVYSQSTGSAGDGTKYANW